MVVAETRERDAAPRAARRLRGNGIHLTGTGPSARSRGADSAGQHPENFQRKIAPRGNEAALSCGNSFRFPRPGLAANRPPGNGSATRNAGHRILAGLKRGLEILYGLYFAAMFLLWIVPAWAMVQFITDHKKAGRFTSSALKILFAVVGCQVRVVGKEHMETPGAKIYASNHTSYFDVLPLMLGLGVPYRFISKMEVGRMPFIGTFLDRMGHLKFDRTAPESRLRQAQEMEEFLRNGESVFVFPEGTFTGEDGVRPFQLGAFKAAVATGTPIIPVSLAGTRKFLREGTYLPRPTNITITLSPPIYPSTAANTKESAESSDWHELIRLRDATRDAIVRHAGEPLL